MTAEQKFDTLMALVCEVEELRAKVRALNDRNGALMARAQMAAHSFEDIATLRADLEKAQTDGRENLAQLIKAMACEAENTADVLCEFGFTVENGEVCNAVRSALQGVLNVKDEAIKAHASAVEENRTLKETVAKWDEAHACRVCGLPPTDQCHVIPVPTQGHYYSPKSANL